MQQSQRNPLDTTEYFVRHSIWTFRREPDAGGLAYWAEQLAFAQVTPPVCGSKGSTSAPRSFASEEFQTDRRVQSIACTKAGWAGNWVMASSSPDHSRVIGGPDLAASKRAFTDQLVRRASLHRSIRRTRRLNHSLRRYSKTVASAGGRSFERTRPLDPRLRIRRQHGPEPQSGHARAGGQRDLLERGLPKIVCADGVLRLSEARSRWRWL